MLHIHHDDDAQHPSKAYADACWAANLSLSPDWWREALGYTVGKLALDWRTAISQPEHLATGSNLILVSVATWPEVSALLAATPSPHAYMVVLITSTLDALPANLPAFVIWQPTSPTPENRQQALVQLEDLAKTGQIEAYGISMPDPVTHPLHLWLEDAAIAANTVWARRKRPALRLIHGNLDLLDLSLLTEPATLHKTETVSTLELAARLSLTLLITASALPLEAAPTTEALDHLTQIATIEHEINQRLNGWPSINGQPLFSVLSHLAQGLTPWPNLVIWQSWQAHVWPQLQTQWGELSKQGNTLLIKEYLQILQAFLPYGPSLAAAASAPLAAEIIQKLAPHFPSIWKDTGPATQTYALLTSIPAVTAICLANPFNPQPLHQRPNLADVGAILLEKAPH